MARLLLICLGGAAGTGARYALSLWCRDMFGPAMPFGTLAVNVIGSFLLGVIMYVGLNTGLLSPTARLVLSTGVVGGFTTYAAFNEELTQLVHDRAFARASVYLLGTVVGCFVAGSLGVGAAKWAVGK